MRTKILPFIIIACTCITSAEAQVSAGKVLLGGSFSLYNSSNYEQNTFFGNVQLGTAVKDNTVVGILASYSSNNQRYSVSTPHTEYNYGAGIFYRKYIQLYRRFCFFGEADAVYNHSKNIMNAYDSSLYLNSKSYGGSVSLVPGISYNIYRKLQIELSMPSLINFSYFHISTIDNELPPGYNPQKRNVYGGGINLNNNLLFDFAAGFKFFL